MSSSKLFIGGLSYNTDHQSLRAACSKYGYVAEARVILDRETGRSRGFGFVKYSYEEEAYSVMQALDGQYLHGRRVRVNYAADRARAGGNGGGGGYAGNNAGYGGGDNYGSGGNYPSSFGGGNTCYEGARNYGGGNTGDFNSSNYGVAGGGGVKVYKIEILDSGTFQGGIVLTEILGSFSSDGNFNVSGYEGADNYGGGNTEGFNSSNYGVSGRGGVKVYKLEILGSETFQMKTVLTTEILESFSSDGVAGRGVKVNQIQIQGSAETFQVEILLTMKILGSFSSDGFKVSAGGGCTGGGFNGYRSAGFGSGVVYFHEDTFPAELSGIVTLTSYVNMIRQC